MRAAVAQWQLASLSIRGCGFEFNLRQTNFFCTLALRVYSAIRYNEYWLSVARVLQTELEATSFAD